MPDKHIIDTAQKPRTEDSLDAEKLLSYLNHKIDSPDKNSSLEILQFPGGASNLTYQLTLNGKEMILRTSPKGANIKGAHDMGREFHVLDKLRPYFSYCPKAIAYCEDETILGRPFFIMEKITGIIPRKEMPIKLSSSDNLKLCQNLIKIHADLHNIDIYSTGLIELGKPEGYVARQISGWSSRYEKARTDDVPTAEHLMDWLDKNKPADHHTPALIHNDYKFDNVVLDPKNPTEIIAILDWEMATVGDPLMDLGCSLAYWIEKDDPAELQMIRMMPTTDEGMMSRQQLINYYARLRGEDLGDFRYYTVFGLFRLAVIAQQIYQRFVLGKTHNKKFKDFGKICSILIHRAESYCQ
ncbi:MAG TPA: phosphotransferase family protein [Aeromonadales bacterium]|nr:phosphotransferase family protein [Aeromonadales bacterium]